MIGSTFNPFTPKVDIIPVEPVPVQVISLSRGGALTWVVFYGVLLIVLQDAVISPGAIDLSVKWLWGGVLWLWARRYLNVFETHLGALSFVIACHALQLLLSKYWCADGTSWCELHEFRGLAAYLTDWNVYTSLLAGLIALKTLYRCLYMFYLEIRHPNCVIQ